MDERIFEGACLTINLKKAKYESLSQLCIFPPCDYNDIKSILLIGNPGTCKDFKLFLSILNINFPHIVPQVLMDKEIDWDFARCIGEEDLEVEWWLRV